MASGSAEWVCTRSVERCAFLLLTSSEKLGFHFVLVEMNCDCFARGEQWLGLS